MLRPKVTKRKIKDKYFRCWPTKIKYICLAYWLTVIIVFTLGMFWNELTCQFLYDMSCADKNMLDQKCYQIYGLPCKEANEYCRANYGGMDCSASYIACNDVAGEDCPTGNPKCES